MSPEETHAVEAHPKVLVIDDSTDVHRLLEVRLRTEELVLVSAFTGEEGLSMVEKEKPDIVLLDLDMPGMDGFEVLRALKENSETMHISVIVLSGLDSPQDKVTAFDLGAVDYVTKPFDLTELRVRIRSALRLQQLIQMLAQRAQIDGLTGLWNRAHFEKRWSDEVAGSARHHRPLSLALFDLDHFKSVNDTHGHPAGDHVIQVFAKILQRECRQTDVACRFGGEEFTLVMPDSTVEDAAHVCDRIRQRLEEVIWPRHPERTVTVSVGTVGSDGTTDLAPNQWVEIVDQALYAAKHGGRNKVVTQGISLMPPPIAQAS